MTVKQFVLELLKQKEDDDIVFLIRGSDRKICFSFESAKVYKRTEEEAIIEVRLPNKIVVVE